MIIILLIITALGAKAKVNPYGPTIVNDFTNCVSELIEINFKKPGMLIFANTNNVSTAVANIRAELLKKIHGYAKYSLQVKSPRDEPPICGQNDDDDEDLSVLHMDVFETVRIADYFIIVIDSYKDFRHVISRIIRSRIWNPSAKFIILLFIIDNNDKLKTMYVENILSCLFRYNVYNIVVTVPQSINIRNAIVYSWKPFDPPKYCGYYNETAKNRLLVENTCERGVVKRKKDIYKGKIPNEMEGCILHILALERVPFISSALDDPNIERLFINEMVDKFKFKTHYEIISGYRGERDDMGDWSGALNQLAAKKGHVLLGGIFPDYDVHEDFECTSSYLYDSYIWVVPRAFPRDEWVALIIIFENLVWYSVIASFFICVLSWRILGQLSGESLYQKTLKHCFLNTWISTLGFCAYARPVTNSLRVFYVFFNLYCILFITAYTTKLIDVLKNPTFEEQIDTVEELVESGLKFGGSEELYDLFFNSSDPFDFMIGSQWEYVDNITKALIDVSVYRNFSVLCSSLELAHLSSSVPELSDDSGRDRFYAFEKTTFAVPMEMVALRGFPFIKDFSEMLGIFKQLGVNSAVRRNFASLNLRKKVNILRSFKTEQSDVNALSLDHLQGGFFALAIGAVGGSLVLLIEIMVNSKYAKQKFAKIKCKMHNKMHNVYKRNILNKTFNTKNI